MPLFLHVIESDTVSSRQSTASLACTAKQDDKIDLHSQPGVVRPKSNLPASFLSSSSCAGTIRWLQPFDFRDTGSL